MLILADTRCIQGGTLGLISAVLDRVHVACAIPSIPSWTVGIFCQPCLEGLQTHCFLALVWRVSQCISFQWIAIQLQIHLSNCTVKMDLAPGSMFSLQLALKIVTRGHGKMLQEEKGFISGSQEASTASGSCRPGTRSGEVEAVWGSRTCELRAWRLGDRVRSKVLIFYNSSVSVLYLPQGQIYLTRHSDIEMSFKP